MFYLEQEYFIQNQDRSVILDVLVTLDMLRDLVVD